MLERTFFITTVAYNREAIFRLKELAEALLNTIYDYRAQGKFLLHDFVVMPDHLHLIITPTIKISKERAVQFVKGGFSRFCSKQLLINYEIWQPGFKDHRIRDLADYTHHRNYIHDNPVRAGLVKHPADYRYSSAIVGLNLTLCPPRLKPSLSRVPTHG